MIKQHPYKTPMQDGFFLTLLLVISVAFALIIAPFFAAILWAMVAAILFTPMNQRLLARMPRWPNLSALLTLLLIVALVIIPAILIAASLVQEATVIYGRIQSGEINFALIFERFVASLPEWASAFLSRLGLTNLAAVRETLSAGIASSFRSLATQAFVVGQSAFGFLVALGVMLYLTFFLIRDGENLSKRVIEATPLRAVQRQALIAQFVVVIRATVKGSIVVAILQGVIGGVVFRFLGIEGALLWGVTMGFFSLLPAIGTGLIWMPVAIYLLATGAIWKGAVLIFCGLFVIGMVDNLLRPILVGRDTRMPDYIVLISTLGGLNLFGFSGIVIGPVIAALFIAAWKIIAGINGDGELPTPIAADEQAH